MLQNDSILVVCVDGQRQCVFLKPHKVNCLKIKAIHFHYRGINRKINSLAPKIDTLYVLWCVFIQHNCNCIIIFAMVTKEGQCLVNVLDYHKLIFPIITIAKVICIRVVPHFSYNCLCTWTHVPSPNLIRLPQNMKVENVMMSACMYCRNVCA